MYLVSVDKYHKTSQHPPPSYGKTNKKKSKKPLVTNTRQNKKQHSYDKWVKLRERIQDTNVQREAIIKQIAQLLRKVLPTDTLHQRVPPKRGRSPSFIGTQTPQPVDKILFSSYASILVRGTMYMLYRRKNCCRN